MTFLNSLVRCKLSYVICHAGHLLHSERMQLSSVYKRFCKPIVKNCFQCVNSKRWSFVRPCILAQKKITVNFHQHLSFEGSNGQGWRTWGQKKQTLILPQDPVSGFSESFTMPSSWLTAKDHGIYCGLCSVHALAPHVLNLEIIGSNLS